MELKNIIEIAGTVLGIGLIALASWFRRGITNFFVKVGRAIVNIVRLHRHSLVKLCLTPAERKYLYPGTDTFGPNRVKQYMQINQELSTLLTRTDADRAYIFKFHNGSYFSPDEPIWKMSNFCEICKPHIRYYSNELQDIKISLLINVLGPLLLGNLAESDNGVRKMQRCKVCPYNFDCSARNMYIIDVDQSKPSHMKQIWQNRGIKHTVVCNLRMHNQNMGIMGIDYCHNDIKDINSQYLCESAERVQFLLSQKQEG